MTNSMDLFNARFCVDKPTFQWDKEIRGFGIRLNRDGSRLFIAKISVNGCAKWFTIGPMDVIKMEDARRLVGRMKLLAKGGEDPESILKAFQRSEGINACAGITFAEFTTIYIEQYAKIHKRSWLKDEQRINFYLMKDWGPKRLSEISRLTFNELFAKIGKKRKIGANRLKETVTTMFKQAIILGYLPANHPMPTFGVKKFKQSKRKDKIGLDKLPRLAVVLKEYPDQLYSQAMILILMTGLRHGECISLRWDWFDFTTNELTIPDSQTKNGEGHILPLTPPLLRLLATIKRYPSNPHVFPSKNKPGCHVYSLTKAWQKIRVSAGIPKIRIHDLRRSVGCLILDQTGDLTMVRDVLNHTDEHVTAVYGFYDTAGLKPILHAHGQRIEAAMSLLEPEHLQASVQSQR